ncbi:MAG: GAP family protein [Dehalococcoidia bacterium]|nr:GAP family protein [Dehalococcoidia bacterium]
MGAAIGDMLPSASGVAISPIPIIAVILMLVSERGKVNGAAFVVGWWLGVGLVLTVVLLLADSTGASSEDEPATWVSLLQVALGVLLLWTAARQWNGLPKDGEQAPMPKWMQALDTFTPMKSASIGVLLSGLNPKNLLLTIAGATAIGSAGVEGGDAVIAALIFVLVASAGVVIPVALTIAMGARSATMLEELRVWLTDHNAAIVVGMLLIFSVKMLGDGLVGLF